MIIAIDGPAASGKGSVARGIAAHFGYPHLDTGLLYRAVSRHLLDEHGGKLDVQAAEKFARRLAAENLGDTDRLRTSEVDGLVSEIAALPEVRAAVLEVQRKFATHPPGGSGGVVLDGRDIGTVVLPDADVKIFVTADIAVRSERRFQEFAARGKSVARQEVLAGMEERDARDSTRDIAPLNRAADAYLLDTTHLGIEEAVNRSLAMIAKHQPSVAET